MEEEGTNSVVVLVTASEPSAIQPDIWDRSLEFGLEGEDDPSTLLFKTEENLIAFAMLRGTEGADEAVFAGFLDLKEGVLRYESRRQDYDASTENSGSRHLRMMMQGEIDEDGNYSSLDHAEGIYSAYFTHPNSTDSDLFVSIKGDNADGFKIFHLVGSSDDLTDPATYSDYSPVENCFSDDGSGTCLDNDGITFTKASDTDFILIPGEFDIESIAWAKSENALLDFESVTTEAVQ